MKIATEFSVGCQIMFVSTCFRVYFTDINRKKVCLNAFWQKSALHCFRVLKVTKENKEFCYPANKIPYCRVEDLGLGAYFPMDARCKLTGGKRKSPTKCTFICPSGSNVRGVKSVTCTKNGIWNEVDPECCELLLNLAIRL